MDVQHQLIEAAKRGSERAFEQLIISVEAQMLSVAASLASYPDEADDIYQEAMISAYKALPKFRSESQFSTWLYRILVNTALSYKRRLSHRFSRHEASDNDSAFGCNAGQSHERYANPDHTTENWKLNRAFNAALKKLSNKERVAFVLCHQQELSILQAAEVMGCSDGSVKSYLFRGRDKLRKMLQDYQR